LCSTENLTRAERFLTMTPADMKKRLQTERAERILEELLSSDTVVALENRVTYEEFKNKVRALYPRAEQINIVGSGCWGFSLNPTKGYRAFCEDSDIDVAVMSEEDFLFCWEALREYHRAFFYRLDSYSRSRLRRHGEDVYSGFISVTWIPDVYHPLRRDFIRKANLLRDATVKYREVRILIFRNKIEAIDYYKRGLVSFARSA
jgi:hypothetical protein